MKIRTIIQPVRKCGFRQPWGSYLVSRQGTKDGALPHYVVADTPIPVQRKPHRSPIHGVAASHGNFVPGPYSYTACQGRYLLTNLFSFTRPSAYLMIRFTMTSMPSLAQSTCLILPAGKDASSW